MRRSLHRNGILWWIEHNFEMATNTIIRHYCDGLFLFCCVLVAAAAIAVAVSERFFSICKVNILFHWVCVCVFESNWTNRKWNILLPLALYRCKLQTLIIFPNKITDERVCKQQYGECVGGLFTNLDIVIVHAHHQCNSTDGVKVDMHVVCLLMLVPFCVHVVLSYQSLCTNLNWQYGHCK